MDLKHIVGHFFPGDPEVEVQPFGGGHINDTYRVGGLKAGEMLLQKINHFVFKDVDGLMKNIDLVTRHIHQKMMEAGENDIDQRTLRLIANTNGGLYFKDREGGYWRMMNFIPNHKVYDRAPNADIAYEGARMFGNFITLLSDLDPKNVSESIPDFHNIDFRLTNLETAIRQDVVGRVAEARQEIQYVQSAAEVMRTILRLGKKGVLPKRVVHNDTKINNVLFDSHDAGLCVVDLDTVMPGYTHYDFGDVIRTAACLGEEDESDLSKMVYDLRLFEALTEGFLLSTRDMLIKEEADTLGYAALLFPYIMGVRFLTDYLSGDVYYKTQYPGHNLVRAKAQLHLAADGEKKLKEMQSIIQKNYHQ